DRVPGQGTGSLHGAQQRTDRLVDIDSGELGIRASGVEAGDLEEVLDEDLHALHAVLDELGRSGILLEQVRRVDQSRPRGPRGTGSLAGRAGRDSSSSRFAALTSPVSGVRISWARSAVKRCSESMRSVSRATAVSTAVAKAHTS